MAVIVQPDDPRDLAYDRQVARQFGRFTSGWSQGATARVAWFLTIALAALVVGNIGLNVAVNRWNRVFFDALERRDGGTLGLAVLAFAGLVVVIAGIGVLIVLTRETLQVRWREWLVRRLTDLWLGRQRYYRLNIAQIEPANEIGAILDERALGHWSDRLDAFERWDQILSSGERQRLAFARLFLQKPAIAILDEAMSALDETSQTRLMALMRSELPATTVIAVGQRSETWVFYDRCLRLVREEGGARLVADQTLAPLRVTA